MLVYYLVTALHVVVCLILILVVLLQSSKGADLAGAFGGATTQTAFGSRGPASFLSKMTTVSAVIFMVTCLALSLMGGRQQSRSILDTTKQPVSQKPAVQPTPQAPAPSPEEIKKIQQEVEQKQKQDAATGQGAAPGASTSSGNTTPVQTPAKESKPGAAKKP
jgi:preprotein translocase subunit SecG